MRGDDNALYFATDGSAAVHHGSVIARNRVTRQSIVPRGTRTEMRFGCRFTVDRHGLCPRDDNTLVYRLIKRCSYTTTVSLRGGSVSEGRGNPSCLEGHARGMRFVYWFTVDRHGHFSMPSR